KPTLQETKAIIFGDRARKVSEVKTKHLILWTDSRAALGKFSGSLERTYEFVRKKLGLPHMKERLPIYIFQSAKSYQDFCVDYAGYDDDDAEHTAGHGCSRYFATYFTEPNDPVVAHELVHSIVHRVLGPHGGPWLHEGFAEYVESAYSRKDIVKLFSMHLKNGSYTPLSQFIGIKTLAFVETKRDSSKPSRLYQQAGAFFAFLNEGPFKDKYEELTRTLTKNDSEPEDRKKILEKIYGMELDELEKKWVEWGTKKK
ncbi:MAG: hypothetical protein ACYTFG_08990, partial [Planctomycetota bacterium]